jgi:hypothetical protein
MPSGQKSYVIQYLAERKKIHRKSLGMHGVVPLEEARKKAFKILAAVQSGDDPVGDERAKHHALNVNDLAKRFIEEHIEVHLKPRTADGYTRNLKKFILPHMSHLKITDVTRADISAFHHTRRKSPYEANRCLENDKKPLDKLGRYWQFLPLRLGSSAVEQENHNPSLSRRDTGWKEQHNKGLRRWYVDQKFLRSCHGHGQGCKRRLIIMS